MNECRRCDRPMGKHPKRDVWRCGTVTCSLFDVQQDGTPGRNQGPTFLAARSEVETTDGQSIGAVQLR
jgi:hypothetical protein